MLPKPQRLMQQGRSHRHSNSPHTRSVMESFGHLQANGLMLWLGLRTCRSGSVAALISCILARKRGPWSPSFLCCPFVKTYAWIISCSSTSCPARNESAVGQGCDLHASCSSLTHLMHELQPAACRPALPGAWHIHKPCSDGGAMLVRWSGVCHPTLGHSRGQLQHYEHKQGSPAAATNSDFKVGKSPCMC